MRQFSAVAWVWWNSATKDGRSGPKSDIGAKSSIVLSSPVSRLRTALSGRSQAWPIAADLRPAIAAVRCTRETAVVRKVIGADGAEIEPMTAAYFRGVRDDQWRQARPVAGRES